MGERVWVKSAVHVAVRQRGKPVVPASYRGRGPFTKVAILLNAAVPLQTPTLLRRHTHSLIQTHPLPSAGTPTSFCRHTHPLLQTHPLSYPDTPTPFCRHTHFLLQTHPLPSADTPTLLSRHTHSLLQAHTLPSAGTHTSFCRHTHSVVHTKLTMATCAGVCLGFMANANLYLLLASSFSPFASNKRPLWGVGGGAVGCQCTCVYIMCVCRHGCVYECVYVVWCVGCVG